MDRILFPVTSRKISIAISAVIIALLSLILFSVRQNILTYDNTLETVYFILTVIIAYGIGSWFLLGYVKQTARTTATTTANMSPIIQRSPLISLLHVAMVVVQFAMLGIMLFVIFNRSSEYLMPYVNAVTSVFATIILGAFAYKFAKWYTLSNKKLVVLLCFLTVLTLAIMVSSDLALKYTITTRVEKSAPGEVSREKVLYKDFEGGQLLKQDIEPDYTK
jgi:flagellar biosynthesis protein FlhB